MGCLVVVHWAAAGLPLISTNPENSVASLIRALMPDGPRATQHAICCDAIFRAVDHLRHGSREHPLALFRARPQ